MKPLRQTLYITEILEPEHWPEMRDLGMAVYARAQGNLLRYVKATLGRQTRTFLGEFRYYLWERDKYTIWISNKKGFVVEVIPGLTKEDILDCYRQACKELTPDSDPILP